MVIVPENVTRLKAAQINPAAQMMARAFQNDALYAYLIPDAADRINILPHMFMFRLRYGLQNGEVYTTSTRLEGAAVWIPSQNSHMTPWKMLRAGGFAFIRKAGKEVMGRISSFGDYAAAIHHRHAPDPHWHLTPIAVDPTQQGKGYARLLLQNMLSRLDKEHMPCYLETQSEKNVAIYRKYGFEVVEQGIIPGTPITHWAMLRKSFNQI
jgi:ribosomal protein S18 acetylase RimI-like enzyme